MEKAIRTSERPMGAGESLRRVLECVASGILLEGELCIELLNQHECSYTGININTNANLTVCSKMALESKIHVRRKKSTPLQF